jgi:hypothetical protein
VQEIWISWQFATPWETIISGPQEKGKIKLVAEGNVLEIYLKPEDMDIGCPPPHLAQEILGFCRIEKREHYIVLYHVLMQKEARRIEENLKEQGIPDDIPDDIPELPGEVTENNFITADDDESKTNNSAQDEVDSPVELSSPPPGEDSSSESISYPTHETIWGKVPSATKATAPPSDGNARWSEPAFLSPPISTIGGGRNYDTDKEQGLFLAELYVSFRQYHLSC